MECAASPPTPVCPILAQGHLGDFWWEVRAEDPAVTGFSWTGRGVPKPLPHSGPHLLASLQHSCPPATPRRLPVVVGLDGMSQEERRKWRKLLKVIGESSDDRPPHVSWINAVRNSQPQHHTPLAGAIPDAQRRHRVPQLYVGRRRVLWTYRDVMTQLLIYAYQAEMTSREDITPWLEDYIHDALPRALPDDLPFFLEVVLKTFSRPLDARGLRVHLRYLWQTEQRVGGIDRRLVRNETLGDDKAQEQDRNVHQPKTRWRSIPPVVTTPADAALSTLSPDQAAARLGLTWRQLRYMIDQGKIQTIRRGRYWRIPVAEVERLKRRCQRRPDLKALRRALTMLRARIQGGTYQSAHRWLNRQHADGQLPRQIFEGLAAAPRAQEGPELLTRIRELIESLSPETGWEA